MEITTVVLLIALATLTQASLRLLGGPAVSSHEITRQADRLRQGMDLATVERATSSFWERRASWL